MTRHIATDDPVAWCVCLCQYLCHAAALCETADEIDVLFRVETFGDPGHAVLDGGFDPPTARMSGRKYMNKNFSTHSSDSATGFDATFAKLLKPLVTITIPKSDKQRLFRVGGSQQADCSLWCSTTHA